MEDEAQKIQPFLLVILYILLSHWGGEGFCALEKWR